MSPGEEAYFEVLRRLDEQRDDVNQLRRMIVEGMPQEGSAGGNSVELTRQGVKISGAQVNVILLSLIFAGMCAIAYGGYKHDESTVATSKAFVDAIKEQTSAMKEGTAAQREQTCIMKFDQKERREHAEWCRQVSGAAPAGAPR